MTKIIVTSKMDAKMLLMIKNKTFAQFAVNPTNVKIHSLQIIE